MSDLPVRDAQFHTARRDATKLFVASRRVASRRATGIESATVCSSLAQFYRRIIYRPLRFWVFVEQHFHVTYNEWLVRWTQALKGPGSNRSRDAVG